MTDPPTRVSGPFRPTRLGSWEVIAKIAGGGMSAVYLGRRALDGDTTDARREVVALKIVRHDAAKNDQLVRMFLEEGKLLARLVHPNIVRTLEVGGDAAQDYIAMELLLGKTFAAIHDALVARKVRLNPEIAAWTAARIADALHYAHELADEYGRPLALVHRDVNPANVFATFKGEVKLFDFGLAKVTANETAGSKILAGKLSYLSPEQIMQKPLDRRSDVFSLGTTLWELCTSKRLFRRETDVETVRAVQLGPIPDPRTVAPELPEELARITRTALERNRDHRYPSAAHVAHELDAFVRARTTPGDVTARLAQLVDALFPGEQKRQSGWLKPAIIAGGPRSIPPTSSSRPSPLDLRGESVTAVRTAPPAPPSSGRGRPSFAPTYEPAPNTARSGPPSWQPPISRPTGAPPPSVPQGARGASFAPPAPTLRSAPPPPLPPRTMPPRASQSPPRPSVPSRAPAPVAPSLSPPADRESSTGGLGGFPRKRAPIPLPSQTRGQLGARTEAPAATRQTGGAPLDADTTEIEALTDDDLG